MRAKENKQRDRLENGEPRRAADPRDAIGRQGGDVERCCRGARRKGLGLNMEERRGVEREGEGE